MTATIITAISTLLGVWITLYFTNKNDKSRFFTELNLQEFNELANLYISLLAHIEKAKDYTKNGKDYDELLDESTIISAKINLFASDEIRNKLVLVNSLLFEWSSLYRKSLPRRMSNSDYAIISSEDNKYRNKADELYPKLFEEIGDLVNLISKELKTQKKKLKK